MTTPEIHYEKFEAWLLSQSDEREFDYMDTENCLVCMFLKETTNAAKPHCGGETYLSDYGAPVLALPSFVRDALSRCMLDCEYYIFEKNRLSDTSWCSFAGMKKIWLKLHPESVITIDTKADQGAVKMTNPTP